MTRRGGAPRSQKASPRREKPTVGLVVEGETEFDALPLLHREHLVAGCPPLRAVNLRGVGSHLDPIGVAKMVAPKVIAHVAAGRTRVIVCIDREQRDLCAGAFAQAVGRELAAELRRLRCSSSDVHVVIADRTFEAWLLADARGLNARGHLKSAPRFHCFEGQMGKQGKKGVVELTQLLGRPYDKTSDGKSLFREVDFATARKYGPGHHGSRSLDKLLRTLGV